MIVLKEKKYLNWHWTDYFSQKRNLIDYSCYFMGEVPAIFRFREIVQE